MIDKICGYCKRPYRGRANSKYCCQKCSMIAVSFMRRTAPLAKMQKGVVVGVQEGVAKRKARLTRIEWIGHMDDQRRLLLDRGDLQGLLRLAEVYARGDKAKGVRPMPVTAAQIRTEAGA